MSGFGVTLDALSGITHAVRFGWGDYGYRVCSVEGTWDGSAIAEISHSDGSRFWIAADRYGSWVASAVYTANRVPASFDTSSEAQAALHAHYIAAGA